MSDDNRKGKYDPETFSDGFVSKYKWDDVTVTCLESKFTYNAEGKYSVYEFTGIADGGDEPRTIFYSAGGGVRVSEDGEQLIEDEHGKFDIRKNCDFAKFVSQLKNAGFTDLGAFEKSASAMKGRRIHMREFEVIDFNTKKVKVKEFRRKDGSMGSEPVTKSFPVSLAKDDKAASKVGNGTVADAVKAKTIENVIKVLQAADGHTATKQEIQRGMIANTQGDPDKLPMLTLLADTNWFKSDANPWKFDGVRASL